MADQLRAIALTVDEPNPGLFVWTLLERSAGVEPMRFDQTVETSDEPYDAFDKAARAGLLRWTNLADEGRRGPRVAPERVPLEVPAGNWSPSVDKAGASSRA
jgi:hypothetical protein